MPVIFLEKPGGIIIIKLPQQNQTAYTYVHIHIMTPTIQWRWVRNT